VKHERPQRTTGRWRVNFGSHWPAASGALLAVFLLVAGCAKPVAPLPKLKEIPAFQLTERTGQDFGLAQLRDHFWIANFFYTTCPGPCAALSARMGEVQSAVAGWEDVRLVSISSDPEKDTPAVLRGYAETFKAGARWYFLTGKKDTIYELANQGFLLSLTEDPANKTEPITHATRLVLVDKAGAIRGYYDGMTSEGVAKLVADLRRLREERRDERDTKDTAAR
jgi:protein SCO1/2